MKYRRKNEKERLETMKNRKKEKLRRKVERRRKVEDEEKVRKLSYFFFKFYDWLLLLNYKI